MNASDADRQRISPEPTWAQSTQTTEQMAREIGRLTTVLAESGDAEGTRMYRAWVVQQIPASPGDNVAALLQPIWRFPDEPNLAAAAEELFNGPKSTWQCLPTAVQFRDRHRLMHSPIFGVPAFRSHVARNLNNLTPIGTVSVKENLYEFETANGHSSESGVNMRDPLLPKPPGTKVTVRVCDWYASKIAALDGAPPFELYWPTANRDVARAKLAAFLTQWGDNFRYSALQSSLPRDFRDLETAHLTFPRLDHPATDADVAATRAIFSLSGGPVRIVSLPAWPAQAKWKTLKDFPVQYQGATDSKTGVTTYDDDFLNKGFIWQAEEVQVNGKWERYYGFVGAHSIAKVPADQIEFLKRN